MMIPAALTLRTLFIHGARAVLRYAATKNDRFSRWANALHARRGHNRARVAVANKLARIAWVILAKGRRAVPSGGVTCCGVCLKLWK